MLDITIIAIYLAISLAVGIYKGRNISTFADYAVGSRNYSTPTLVSTIFATFLGAGATLGVTEKIYSIGSIVYIFMFLTHPISKLIISEIVAPRISRFYDLVSVGDIMERFYGKPAKILTGFAGFLLLGGFLGAQISALGVFFHYFTGLSSLIVTIISASVLVIYSAFGGIRAVTATSVFHFCIIIVAIPIIANIAIIDVGGFDQLINAVPTKHITFFPEGKNKLKYVFFFLIFCIPFLNPAIMQRLLMAKDPRQMITSVRISAMLDVPFYITIGTIALCIFVLNSTLEPQFALPYFVSKYLPGSIKGLAIAGILAVIMSAADSYLNAASISFVHDFLKPLFGSRQFTSKQELSLARWFTLFIGAFSIIISIKSTNVLGTILAFSIIWGQVVVVPLYAAILNFNVQKIDFFVGLFGALIAFILWKWTFPDIDATFPCVVGNLLLFSSSLIFRKIIKNTSFFLYARDEK